MPTPTASELKLPSLQSPLGARLQATLAPALSTPNGLTFDHTRLISRSQRAAARLHHEWGVQPGDRVAYLGHNQSDLLCLLFACAELGAVLVPLNWRLAQPELAALLAHSQPALLLHDATHSIAAKALLEITSAYLIDALIAAPAARLPLPAAPKAAAPLLLVYTSGTTAGLNPNPSPSPKGALHTQANLLANADAAIAALGLRATDHVLTALPLFHVGGLCIQTLPALLAGAHVTLHARFDAGAWLADVARLQPSLSLLVPATMQAIINHPAWVSTNLTSLRALWAGSSCIAPHLIEAFMARGVPVCSVYGATETGPVSIVQPPHKSHKIGCTGHAAFGVEVLLRPIQDTPAHDKTGEVLLRAPNIASHYWPNLPTCDAKGWFATGDIARQDADGDYWIVGRCSELIISGGENIYPAEIEHLLLASPAIAEAAVLGLPDAQWGEAVTVALVLAPGWSLTASEVLALLEGRIARFKLPRRICFVDALPKTALGKVQKARLAQLLNAPPAPPSGG